MQKFELEELFKINELGLELNYKGSTEKSPFLVDLKIGDIILASAGGYNIREAEHRTAMNVLGNDGLLKIYAAYEFTKNPKLNHYLQESTLFNMQMSDEVKSINLFTESSPNQIYHDNKETKNSTIKHIDNFNKFLQILEKNPDNSSEQMNGQLTNASLEKINGTPKILVTDIISKTIRENSFSKNDFTFDLSKSVKSTAISNETTNCHLTFPNEDYQFNLLEKMQRCKLFIL